MSQNKIGRGIGRRTVSEFSPLNPDCDRPSTSRGSSYGSFMPYLGFLRHTLNFGSRQVKQNIMLKISMNELRSVNSVCYL